MKSQLNERGIGSVIEIEDRLAENALKIKEFVDENDLQKQIALQKDTEIDNIAKVKNVQQNEEKARARDMMLAEANFEHKQIRLEIWDNSKISKQRHDQILRNEELCRKHALIIKEEKQRKNKCQRQQEQYKQLYEISSKIGDQVQIL